MKHFVYQRVHTLSGRAFHLGEHLTIAARAFEQIYGVYTALDEREITARITDTLRSVRVSERTGATVVLRFALSESAGCDVACEFERVLLDAGYAHSPLRPKAVTYDYSIPFPALPTNFQTEAKELFDALALRAHGATRSVRREGERLISCGDATLFTIRDRVLFTPPLTEGVMDSVERNLVIEAAVGSRMDVREEPILHSQLKDFDELFLADAAGITSLSECDGAKFMSLAAPRLVAAME